VGLSFEVRSFDSGSHVESLFNLKAGWFSVFRNAVSYWS